MSEQARCFFKGVLITSRIREAANFLRYVSDDIVSGRRSESELGPEIGAIQNDLLNAIDHIKRDSCIPDDVKAKLLRRLEGSLAEMATSYDKAELLLRHVILDLYTEGVKAAGIK